MSDMTVDNIRVTGNLTVGDGGISAQGRTSILTQDPNVRFPVPWADMRVHDAYATLLPGTASADDLGLDGGTFGTSGPRLSAGDCKAAGALTRYARFQGIVPECYEAGQTVAIVVSAGMVTTVADTTCTVDFQVYRCDKAGGVSADLCVTIPQSINSLGCAEKTFQVTASSLQRGDILDIRVAIACTDAATGTAVIPIIAGLDVTYDIRG